MAECTKWSLSSHDNGVNNGEQNNKGAYKSLVSVLKVEDTTNKSKIATNQWIKDRVK